MGKRLFEIAILLVFCGTVQAQSSAKYYSYKTLEPAKKTIAFDWNLVAEDRSADGNNSGKSDAKSLYYYFEAKTDTIWFKFELYNEPNDTAFAINLAFDTDTDQATGKYWYGINRDYKYDIAVSYWMRFNEGKLQGINGIADADSFLNQDWTNRSDGSVNFYLDKKGKSYLVGIKRSDIAEKMQSFNVIGAVGEYMTWNDDIPNCGSTTIHLSDKAK